MNVLLFAALLGAGAVGPPADAPYLQDTARHFAWPKSYRAPHARALCVHGDEVWIGTDQGVFALAPGEGKWRKVPTPVNSGAIYDVAEQSKTEVLLATWRGVYHVGPMRSTRLSPRAPMTALLRRGAGSGATWSAYGPDGVWRAGTPNLEPLPCAPNLRKVALAGDGSVWIATGDGLFHAGGKDGVRCYKDPAEILSADVRGVAVDGVGRVWAGGAGGVTLLEDGGRTRTFTPQDGLPGATVEVLDIAPDGRVWVGTPVGAARYDGTGWSVRRTRRWLLDDRVLAMAFGRDGAVWFATPAGLSVIEPRSMTLAAKAAYFMDVVKARHIRKPFVVEKCDLRIAGDLATWRHTNDDNDGSHTGMFVAAESFRYAVTKDPEAREHARRGFDFMRMLQTVTGSPDSIARSIVPRYWRRVREATSVETPRNIAPDATWRRSAVGRWRWKGDAGSDELTGHFYTYGLYHDLAADDEGKKQVGALAARVMDSIIEHGYMLAGTDGKQARWGVWSPEKLNNDPAWRADRGIYALEILSYLKTAHHVTGDAKYQAAYLELLHTHGYLGHLREIKSFAPAWMPQADTELLAMLFPGLIRYEDDAALRAQFVECMERWYRGVRNEQNPFADMTYLLCGGSAPQSVKALDVLRDVPLDLISWTIDQTPRADLRAVRMPILEEPCMDRLVPPSERPTIRWDKNPWAMRGGEDGKSEWAPTFWLLPYWMGRYLHVVQ